MMLVFLAVIILTLLLAMKLAITHRIALKRNIFTFPFLLLSTLFVISTFFQSSSIVTALTTPLSTSTILAGFILYLLFTNLIKEEDHSQIMLILTLDSLFISAYIILQKIGLFPSGNFSPVGNFTASLLFLLVMIVYLVLKTISKILPSTIENGKKLEVSGDASVPSEWLPEKSQDTPEVTFFNLVTLVLSVTAGALLIYHLAKVQKPVILPFYFGWGIFLEVLKDAKTMLLGVGPTNFVAAFTLAKPMSINLTPFWNITFTVSSSFLLNLATETGIIALFSYLLILFQSIRLLWNKTLSTRTVFPLALTLIAALVLQAVLPSNMTVFILTVLLLSIVPSSKRAFEIDFSYVPIFSYILIIPVFAALTLFAYFSGKAYLAEAYFKKSLDAKLNNQGTETFKFVNLALTQNPYLDRYHVALSQTDLALVKALSSKENLSDEDKQNIPQLIQQAIDEAKSATLLNKTNVANWDNLARTYSSLVNFAKGSDSWTIQSYQQKINLDPFSPGNYIALGGVYLNLEKWQEAENQFRYALRLKPDFANAHYNLALALKEQKRYEEAKEELLLTKSFAPGQENQAMIDDLLNQIAKLLPKNEQIDNTNSNKTSSTKPVLDLDNKQVATATSETLPTSLPTFGLQEPQ